jgi:hypothetical protein
MARLGFRGEAAARVLMPEAAVHEDRQAVPGQNDVRLAWEIFSVQAKSQPSSVQRSSHGDLWPRVRGADARHLPATNGINLNHRI